MSTPSLKQKLRAGQAVIGTTLSLPEPFVCEVMGAANFEFLLIDMEHNPITINQLQSIMIAARPTSSTFLVRARWNDPVMVKQILDIGAEGVIFPWVNNREQCEEAVAAAHYPPAGIRGFGPRRAARLHGAPGGYACWAEENVLALVQIERAEAVEALDEILTTPGLDGIMVGPADLAISMGYLHDLENPAVEAAIQRILDSCRKHGVPFGMFTGTTAKARKWISRGGQIATIGGEVAFIDAGIAQTKREIAEILVERG
jgi:2-keto-3-deoxy-L-rhamnonate aldolase RhmA